MIKIEDLSFEQIMSLRQWAYFNAPEMLPKIEALQNLLSAYIKDTLVAFEAFEEKRKQDAEEFDAEYHALLAEIQQVSDKYPDADGK